MKRFFSVFAIMLLCLSVSAYGQKIDSIPVLRNQAMIDAAQIAATIANTPSTVKLGTFDRVNVSGQMDVTLIRVAEGEESKLYYDMKGAAADKFKYEVDKNGVLNVVETADESRTTRTEVKIYYRNLRSLSVVNANLTLDKQHRGDMLDLAVSGGATVRAKLDLHDMAVDVTGRSSVVLEGQTRYMALKVSTAKFDAMALKSMSTIVDASHGAEVSLYVTERLQAETSTSANISYKGKPTIVRSHSSLFGGAITSVEK